jgi:hypothetical protein
VDERTREAETPREQAVPTWVNNLGEHRGTRLRWGDQAAGAPAQGREVVRGSAGAEEAKETSFRSLTRRKALEGESQERWGLKEALKGFRG